MKEVRALSLPVPEPIDALATVIPEQFARPGLSIAQVLAILKAYRRQIALIAFSIVLITGVIAKLMPKSYTSTATLMVGYEVSDPLGGKELPEGLLGSFTATQVQLLQSPEVLLPVIDALQLTKDAHYTTGYRGNGDNLRDWVMTQLQRNLIVNQSASQLINVTVIADTAAKAMTIANTIADTYADQELLRASGPSRERGRRYDQQLAELKAKVTAAQDRLAEFRQRTGVTDVVTQNDNESQTLTALEQKLTEAQNLRRAAEVKAAGSQTMNDSVMSSMLIQGMKTQLATQESQLAQLATTLGPQHPRLVELRSQIDATRRALNAEVQTYAGSHSAEMQAARQLEQKQQQAVAAQRDKVLAARTVKDEGAKLQLELDSSQTLYKRALDGYDEIMFSKDRNANVTIVSRAMLPVKASKPDKIKIALLGVVAGLAFGILGPLGYALTFNRRVRCRDDVERDLGIPVLAEFGVARLTMEAA